MSRSVSNSLYKYNMCLLKELPAHREVDISRLTGAARGARIRNRQCDLCLMRVWKATFENGQDLVDAEGTLLVVVLQINPCEEGL
jgi:hypothetical protein